MEEQTEQESPKETKVEKDQKIVDNAAEVCKDAKKKEPTPEELREKAAQVIQIKLYPDGILNVTSVRNVVSRAMTEYLITRAKDDYFKADIASLTVMRLIDVIANNQKNKKKTGGLWLGGKKN